MIRALLPNVPNGKIVSRPKSNDSATCAPWACTDMNKIALASEIKYRQKKAKECAKLAAAYAKEKKFGDAARHYNAADFHATMALALKSGR